MKFYPRNTHSPVLILVANTFHQKLMYFFVKVVHENAKPMGEFQKDFSSLTYKLSIKRSPNSIHLGVHTSIDVSISMKEKVPHVEFVLFRFNKKHGCIDRLKKPTI